jgi:2-polyprenyl-3-methyl-5-hydroxy-6-metoxy-1,4-benzoquinol methylase
MEAQLSATNQAAPKTDQGQLEKTRKEIARSSGGTSGEAVRAAALELIRNSAMKGAAADVGAGKGELICSLLQMNCFSSITGLDLRDRPVDLPPSIRWCDADLNQPLSLPDNSFDAVISLGLIEYLENPYAFAREIYRVLRPGGKALLTTPNNESWRSMTALLLRGHFVGFPLKGSNINLTALLRVDFEKILRFAGFQQPSFSYSRFGMLPKFPVSWQAVSGGLLRGMRFSDDLLVTCEKS